MGAMSVSTVILLLNSQAKVTQIPALTRGVFDAPLVPLVPLKGHKLIIYNTLIEKLR
jgi:hypothetical protein